MKRILALICVLACLCGFALPALAAPDTITVTAQVPEDWTNIHLYVWDDAQSALAEWPGTAMNKTKDGRYSLEIPMGYNNLIINNGSDEKKTADLKGDGICDTWVVVRNSLAEVLFADPGVVDLNAAAPLVNMALLGEGNNALKWDTADSSCNMTKSSDGVYTKELTMYKGETIKFKFCGNGAWDAGYNYGGNAEGIALTAGTAVSLVQGNESKDLSYTATQDCTLTVTLDTNGDAPSVTVTEAAAQLAEKVFVKIYVSVPDGISPNMWAWGDNSNAFPTWPGQAMTKSGDWYVVEIPNDCHSALVNDGTTQTSDLTITAGAENWIVVAEDWTAQVYGSEPSLESGDTGNTDKPSTDNTNTNTDNNTTDGSSDEDKGGINPLVIVTIVLCVAAVGAVVVTVIIVIKKKKA